jgi:hypothetical protein
VGEEHAYPSSWRLHRAHPALGLEEGSPARPTPRELGVAWLALPAGEQRRREADFETEVRRAARPGSDWSLDIVEDREVLAVAMDRWKAPALERHLLDHVWDEARRREASVDLSHARRRREVERTLRAHVLVAWDRHGFKAFLVVMAFAGVLGMHPWGDRSIGAVAPGVVAAVVVVIALGRLIERWYRHADRAHE